MEKWYAAKHCFVVAISELDAHQLVHQEVDYYEWHEPPIVDWALPERIAMRKPKSFDWQKEYRFAVPKGNAFRVETGIHKHRSFVAALMDAGYGER